MVVQHPGSGPAGHEDHVERRRVGERVRRHEARRLDGEDAGGDVWVRGRGVEARRRAGPDGAGFFPDEGDGHVDAAGELRHERM